MSTETVNQTIPAGTWTVDPVHSSVNFAVTHMGISTFRSRFDGYSATLTGGEEPRLEGTVEVASIQIEEPQLKGHLLSPEFFDAERFPQLRFGSTELTVSDDGSVRIEGELEIRGETKKVGATGKFAELGEDHSGGARVGLSLAAAVDRRDFGLSWQAELPKGGDVLEWEVAIEVNLELLGQGS